MPGQSLMGLTIFTALNNDDIVLLLDTIIFFLWFHGFDFMNYKLYNVYLYGILLTEANAFINPLFMWNIMISMWVFEKVRSI